MSTDATASTSPAISPSPATKSTASNIGFILPFSLPDGVAYSPNSPWNPKQDRDTRDAATSVEGSPFSP